MSKDKPLHKANHAQLRQHAESLVRTEQDLHRLGLHATARAVNKAVQTIGWEFAGDFDAIAKLKEESQL